MRRLDVESVLAGHDNVPNLRPKGFRLIEQIAPQRAYRAIAREQGES